MIVRRQQMGEAPAFIISGAGRLAGMGALGGEVADAFKTLASNVGTRVNDDLSRVELALKVAAYASAAAAVFSLIAAVHAVWKRR